MSLTPAQRLRNQLNAITPDTIASLIDALRNMRPTEIYQFEIISLTTGRRSTVYGTQPELGTDGFTLLISTKRKHFTYDSVTKILTLPEGPVQ